MKKQLLYFALLYTAFSFAQVGINTTTPDASSMLDISATDKGVLVPRISLTNVTLNTLDGTNTAATGLLIWNTNATTVGGNGVGFYFFNGTQWMPITQTATVNNLDQAYDQGGAGAGKNIDATDGAVRINGTDGFLVTGISGNGNTIDIELTGAGTRMFFNPRKSAFRAGRIESSQWDNDNIGSLSTAFGYNTTASGSNSTSFGNNNIASGQGSTAFGVSTEANAIYSTAFGSQSTASGSTATAFGFNTIASGSQSTAFGGLSTASGTRSSAFGSSAFASGDYSTAFGYSTVASGNGSTAFGFDTDAIGNYSTAFGYNTEAIGNYSTAIGYGNEARSFGETIIGIGATFYSVSTNGNTEFKTANQNDRLFVIGNAIDLNENGTFDGTEASNALTIYKNGRMNINDAYNMPLTDGTSNQIMRTDGIGNVSWVTPTVGTDDQNLTTPSLTGTTLNLGIENGTGTSINLSSLVGTDDQNLLTPTLTGTTLNLNIENGTGTSIDLASLSNDWKLTGNSGTDSSINFIGTTDNQDLVFKRNNGYSGAIRSSNTSLGLNTLNQATTGDSNAAFGVFTLTSNTDGESNSALGYNVLRNNTSGSFNVAIGRSALFANTIGVENTALGNNSNSLNTTSSGNIAVGFDALASQSFNNGGSAWYSYNTAVGYASLRSNQPSASTNAIQNTAVGAFTLNNNLRGKNNTSLGFEALRNNRNSSQNVAIGSRALFTQSFPNGGSEWESNNVAIGFESLFSNQPTNATNAINNTAIGTQSSYSNTTGIGNTAIGYRALYTNTNSSNNVAIGINALTLNTSTSNVAVGAYSLSTNVGGTENTAVGRAALDTNTSGNYNTAIGRDALNTNSTGDGLTGLGRGTDVSVDGLTNATAIGYNAVVNASNKIRIGNAGVTVIEGQVAYSFPSDARFKFNVQDNVPGLLFIKKLKPITYQFDTEKFDSYVGKNNAENNTESFQKSKEIIHSGFLAQDIEKVCQELKYDFDGLHIPDTTNQTDHYSLAYSQFIMPMVKAIQEQQEIIEQQNNELEQLKSEIKQLKTLEERIKLLENK